MFSQYFIKPALCIVMLLAMSTYMVVAEESYLFGSRQVLGVLKSPKLDEVSGVVASQQTPGVLWVHNDSGDANNIYAVSEQGDSLAAYTTTGCWAFDWEDVALGPGSQAGESYLYIGDIGDNRAIRPFVQVCRAVEPRVKRSPSDKSVFERPLPLTSEVFTFQYPDGAKDAEALLIDPLTNNLYIISKRDEQAMVYVARYPYSASQVTTLEKVAQLPMRYVTAADISADGRHILLLTSKHVYYWSRALGQTLEAAFKQPPQRVTTYRREYQDEALGWAYDARGFYITSEELYGREARIDYYPVLTPAQTKQ